MRQYVYRIRPTRLEMLADKPTKREAMSTNRHFEYLRQLAAAGIVLLAGRTLTTDEGAFGIVVFSAESEAAARQLVADDPAVRDGVMSAELWPFRVSLWSADGLTQVPDSATGEDPVSSA